jgi:hypothetical protein
MQELMFRVMQRVNLFVTQDRIQDEMQQETCDLIRFVTSCDNSDVSFLLTFRFTNGFRPRITKGFRDGIRRSLSLRFRSQVRIPVHSVWADGFRPGQKIGLTMLL